MFLVGECGVTGNGGGVLSGVGSKFGFCSGNINTLNKVEGKGFDVFEVVIVTEEGGEFFFAAVEAD